MRIVRIPRYYCEICNMQFIDSESARTHEEGCRREAFLRDGLIGKWVSKGGKVIGIACMTRVHDANVGVMDPLKGNIGWFTPSVLTAVSAEEGRKEMEDAIEANIREAVAKAGRVSDAES